MGEAQAPMQEIQRILDELKHPLANNDPILVINQMAMMQARNNGYPRHLYHQTLDPVVVINVAQEQALTQKGYVRNYIPRQYPKAIYRRNPDPKYEADGFIECRIVAGQIQEAALKKGTVVEGYGPWVDTPADIEPIVQGSEEDLKLKIAGLEGQLAEAHAAADNRKKG